MKKLFFILTFAICYCLNISAQATSLTIDCQTPGWLSSMINYGDQQTLENIKVTGYINDADLTFIGSMNTNQKLKGIINLEDVQIVANNPDDNNKLTKGYFGGHIQHLILPKKLASANACLSGATLDTLTIGGEALSSINSHLFYKTTYQSDGVRFSKNVKHLILREGVITIERCAFYLGTGGVFESIVFPNSLVNIEELAFQGCNSLHKADLTDNIEEIGDYAFANTGLYSDNDTIRLPHSLKTFYLSSFAKSGKSYYTTGGVAAIECYGNQHIYIPKNVVTIDCGYVRIFGSYEKCYLHIENETPPAIRNMYDSMYASLIVYVPKGSVDIYKSDPAWQNATILAEPNPAKSIDIDVSSINIKKGNTMQLNAVVLPDDADDKSCVWSTSDSNIVSVSQNGIVTAISSGEAKVFAKLNIDKTISDSCLVKVYQPVTSIALNTTTKNIKVGDTFNLEAIITPVDADNKNVVWASGDNNIATVDAEGKVTAIKAGEVTITATSVDNPNAKATCNVTVIQPVNGITLSYESYQLNGIGKSFELKATVTPNDASNKNIKWKSTDETVCIVSPGQANASENPNCTITSIGKGTCTIIASTVDGGYAAICAVTVVIPKYKLIYMVDGVEYKKYDIEYGVAITPEAAPTKEGYTFSGWSEIPKTMPAHDVTVTGTFTINKYKLIYKVDGVEYKSYELGYGTKITPEPEPTKEGYTFSGWSEIPQTMPAKDVTVTGTFTINKYKLTYMVDDVEYKSYQIEYGAKITPEAEPTKEGYSFSGWSSIPETMPANDVVVTGTFTKGAYKLTYMVDGEVYKTVSYDYGATITPEAAPTKEGYTFSGWSEIPKTMPAKDVIVTGSFTINKYKLTYIIDNVEYKSYEIEYGVSITPESAPTKEGYTFSGWSEIPQSMPAKDVIVTGTFTINTYKLTYMVDGTEYKSYDIEYGATITSEAEPTKEGYTFSGWNEIPETMPAGNVTIIGSFTVNKYMLTYIIDGEVYKTYEVEYGANITPEAAPEKEGYDFSGWDYVPETMPAHDVTVTATFTLGISDALMDSEDVKFFDTQGNQIGKLKKGINIIVYKNGERKKVVIK